MADDVRAEEFREQLRETFAARIRSAAPDLPPAQALQLADALVTTQMDVLAAKRVTYRSPEPTGGSEITDSWNEGMKIGEIMARHSCSKATAYRWHPQSTKRYKRV